MPDEVPLVSTADLAEAQEGGAVVIDVRTAEEYDSGHVPGVTHMPLDELPERWEDLPTDKQIFIVCHTDGRSRAAATALRRVGIDAVVVEGGTARWIEEGRPVE